MYIKIIEVTVRFFRASKQTILKAGNVEMKVIPTKGDKIFIEDTAYNVLQRDIHFVDDFNMQHITLFVEKM
jgi:hypothetical protein